METSGFPHWLSVCVAAHVIRTVYELLKRKKIIRPNKLTFTVILIVMIALWVSWVEICETDMTRLALPGGIRIAGLAVCIAGVIIFGIALATIRALETFEGDLMTRGIYSFLRHPMYLSFLLWLFGMPLVFGGILSLLIALPLAANVLWWRAIEEEELIVRFPEYPAYRERTYF